MIIVSVQVTLQLRTRYVIGDEVSGTSRVIMLVNRQHGSLVSSSMARLIAISSVVRSNNQCFCFLVDMDASLKSYKSEMENSGR